MKRFDWDLIHFWILFALLYLLLYLFALLYEFHWKVFAFQVFFPDLYICKVFSHLISVFSLCEKRLIIWKKLYKAFKKKLHMSILSILSWYAYNTSILILDWTYFVSLMIWYLWGGTIFQSRCLMKVIPTRSAKCLCCC